MKLRFLFAATLLICCSTMSAADKKFKIGVLPKDKTGAFWQEMKNGAEAAGKRYNAQIVWNTPSTQPENATDQAAAMEKMEKKKFDAILLAPADPKLMVRPVKNALAKGLKVIIIDSGLAGFDGYTSFIATDNYKAGKICAEYMAELLRKKGQIIVLPHDRLSESTNNREKGFIDTMEEVAPKIKILSAANYAGTTKSKAYTEAANLLSRYSYADGAFCASENTTTGMLRALARLDKAGKIKFIGFDANTELLNALKKGKINALAVQNPYRIGYQGVKIAVETLQGEFADSRIDTGIVLATKENLDSKKVKRLIDPYEGSTNKK